MNVHNIFIVLPTLLLFVKITSVTHYIIVASLGLTVVLLCSALLLFRSAKRKAFKQCSDCKAALERDIDVCPHCGHAQT